MIWVKIYTIHQLPRYILNRKNAPIHNIWSKKKEKIKLYNYACVEIGVSLEFKIQYITLREENNK